MRRLLAHSLCLALLVSVLGGTASRAQDDLRVAIDSPGRQIDISYFHDALSSSGEWMDNPTYGACWTPYDMSASWRPYSDGHWEYTDYGWSWASNESWGWATYHYGRWFFDDSYGWVWVPGVEWAPAWVAWRYDDEYVGWAPLPPEAGWDRSSGLNFGDAGRIPTHEWCFVPRGHMLDPNVRGQVTSVARNATLISRSRDATRFEVHAGRPADIGISAAQAGSFVGHRVEPTKIVDVDTPGRGRGRPVQGGVGFFRPAVHPMPAGQAPAAWTHPAPIPARDLQRQQATRQRKLESDLNNEHRRLARDQQNELRSRAPGPAVEQVRQQHAVEQQAFEAHAAQQRQVLAQRMQKQIVPQPKSGRGGKPAAPGRGNERDRGAH